MLTDIIKSMLTENVGSHMCDSGGTAKYDSNGKYIGSNHGYGRNFERNRGIDFDSIPATELEFRYYENGDSVEISMCHNLYHWMVNNLSYAKQYDEMFYGDFLKECDKDDDKNWLELMNEFPEWLGNRKEKCTECNESETECEYCNGTHECDCGNEIGGIYGEGEPFCENTYNHESLLSQTIQYVFFTVDKEPYVIVQVHGGADVRGGYSKPHIFAVSEDDYISNVARGTIYCTGKNHHPSALKLKEIQENQITMFETNKIDFDGDHYWTTDDANHWYEQGTCGKDYKQLDEYEVKLLKEDDEWEFGKLCVTEDRTGYCPECGGKLEGGY